MGLSRRGLLKLGAIAPCLVLGGCAREADDEPNWQRGDLQHLLPTVSHRALNLKASFQHGVEAAPWLRVDERHVEGRRQDSHGRFWSFRSGGLSPGREYTLQLLDAGGRALCGEWPLRTFPAPDAQPERLRIASFTCAGGPDLPVLPGGFHAFKPARSRALLFDALLANDPDLVVANGDHVYWDFRSWGNPNWSLGGKLFTSALVGFYGRFDPARPLWGGENERTLSAVGDDQIARAYGVRFRSTPVFFVTDDHDYFDNDDATAERVTFPPEPFHRALRDGLQRLYFPEFIREEVTPSGLPGRFEADGLQLSRSFGEFRYGDLARGLLYDCGGHLGLGAGAGLVPAAVERWLLERTQREDSAHLVHFPSHPMGWTAGKWREWYPDLLESSGSITARVERDEAGGKYMWQPGWWAQHQRLLRALASQQRRRPLLVSGDLHALGALRIAASGDLDLRENPVYSVLAGPVGTGDLGWPSRARGVETRTPRALEVEDLLEFREQIGFALLDFDRADVQLRLLGSPPELLEPRAPDFEVAARFSLG